MRVRQHHLGRREPHSCADERMGPVGRDGALCDLRENGAHKGFWGGDEQRRAADFRHCRRLSVVRVWVVKFIYLLFLREGGE